MKWYKCRECGHTFREDEIGSMEEKHFLDGHYAGSEHFSCCPECQGDYDDADYCCECDEVFAEDELYSGWCEKCLRETINYDTFFEYCEANKEHQYLDMFMMNLCFDGMDAPKDTTEAFHKHLVNMYKNLADAEKMVASLGAKDLVLLPACIRFIMDDDGSIGRENYADWMNKREAK